MLYSLRVLRKNPAFALLVIVTLGLGIGANTAIFSVVHAILLRGLPYQQPDELVHVWADNPSFHIGITELPPSNADFYDWQARNHVFSVIAAMDTDPTTIGGAEPQRAWATRWRPQASLKRWGFNPYWAERSRRKTTSLGTDAWR